MKKLAPCQAKTLRQICSLRSDNYSTADAWILLAGGSGVCLTNQRSGEPATASVTIPRVQFNRLVDWYLKEQTVSNSVAA